MCQRCKKVYTKQPKQKHDIHKKQKIDLYWEIIFFIISTLKIK
jgi:hypothetical protein